MWVARRSRQGSEQYSDQSKVESPVSLLVCVNPQNCWLRSCTPEQTPGLRMTLRGAQAGNSAGARHGKRSQEGAHQLVTIRFSRILRWRTASEGSPHKNKKNSKIVWRFICSD